MYKEKYGILYLQVRLLVEGEIIMTLHITVGSMKEAERLSDICKDYPYELSLSADRFCVDPKSTLGILAIMYSARDNMMLDTGEMDDTEFPIFLEKIDHFLVQTDCE